MRKWKVSWRDEEISITQRTRVRIIDFHKVAVPTPHPSALSMHLHRCCPGWSFVLVADITRYCVHRGDRRQVKCPLVRGSWPWGQGPHINVRGMLRGVYNLRSNLKYIARKLRRKFEACIFVSISWLKGKTKCPLQMLSQKKILFQKAVRGEHNIRHYTFFMDFSEHNFFNSKCYKKHVSFYNIWLAFSISD